MKENIVLTQTFRIDPLILSEEEYNKRFYLSHPELNLEEPCSQSYLEEMLNNPDSPYKYDKNYQTIHFFKNNIDDNLLNHYHTDIFAFIPPNYMPTLMHGHTYFEIAYVVSGFCINYSGNQILELKSGDFLILAPNTTHAISAFNDSCRIINIMIRTAIFENTFFNIFLEQDILHSFFYNVLYNYKENTYILFHTGEDILLKTAAFQLLEEVKYHHQYHNQMKISYLRLMFMRLLNSHRGNADIFVDNITNKNHNVILILSYMQQHYDSLTLHDVAVFFGYSERQLTRILIKYTGKNFQHNIQQIKMRYAAQMLADTNYSIDKITGKLGYATAYGFRKIFKQEYGITPSEFKKRTHSTPIQGISLHPPFS